MRYYYLTTVLVLPFLTGFKVPDTPTAKPALPPIISIGAAAVPELMDALLQQKTSPQDLWNGGRLNADSLAAVLGEAQWGSAENQPLAGRLCALLVEKAPEKLNDPLALPPRTRLRLAQYFKSIKDVRAVTFYEAILSLIKAPREAGVVEVFELSDYYSEIGDWQKAAETRLRMKDYTTAEPFLANAEGEAARVYMEHGETKKANDLYELTGKSSYGWAAGITLEDEGKLLMEQHKYSDAIKVLLKPVKGMYADQIEVALLALAARCYYLLGDLSNAIVYSNKAIAQYEQLKNPLQNEGLDELLNSAKDTLQMAKIWQEKPFIAEPDVVNLTKGGDEGVTVKIRQYHAAPISITTTSPLISARLVYVPWSEETEGKLDMNKEVYCKMQRDPPTDSTENAIIVRSSEYPNYELRIPVKFN